MKINRYRIQAHIEALAGFTSTPGAGATRLSFSPEYRQACEYVIDYVRSIELNARLDSIGNLRAMLEGRNPEAPSVLIGSHLDTVIHGGNFDGVVGVICGVEILETLVENDSRPRHSIEVISFVEEEGVSFRCPLAGSKALTGVLDIHALESLNNEAGQNLLQATQDFGLDPTKLPQDLLRPDAIKSMFELHIEQGTILESAGLPAGIVQCIAGSNNYSVTLQGQANHAGTTPMGMRLDALACAAQCISVVEEIASSGERPDTVATVGRIRCSPNAANVIPAEVEFSIDVRDVDQSKIDSAAREILDRITLITSQRNIELSTKLTGASSPQPMSKRIVKLLASVAEQENIPCRIMNSGALHDAAMLARITDTGLVFVPSRNGCSHTPGEWTGIDDIETGANLLLAAVIREAKG